MAKGSRGGRRVNQRATPQATASTPTVNGISTGNFTALTDTYTKDLRDVVDGLYTPSVLDAIKQYISKADTGNGYSMAQNLNYKLEHGLPLNANEKFMVKYMTQAMHNIGQDTILYRGAHSDLLQNLGIKDYTKLTQAQLQQSLIGAEFSNKGFTSTSYDKSKNPFYTGSQSGGREVELVIKAPANSKMVFGAKSQAEIVLARDTKFRITGVRQTGRMATPRTASRPMPVVEVEVEVYE